MRRPRWRDHVSMARDADLEVWERSRRRFDARKVLAQVLVKPLSVNVVLGNVDAHAKNHAFLYRRPGTPELSPLFDVVPAVDVMPRAHHHSMRIGGRILIEDVDRAAAFEGARIWSMQEQRAASVLDDTLAHLGGGARA